MEKTNHTCPERGNCRACPKCPRSQPSRGPLSANGDAIFLYSVASILLLYTRVNKLLERSKPPSNTVLSTLPGHCSSLDTFVCERRRVAAENQCNLHVQQRRRTIIDFAVYRGSLLFFNICANDKGVQPRVLYNLYNARDSPRFFAVPSLPPPLFY